MGAAPATLYTFQVSSFTALLGSVVLSFIFVASLYIWKLVGFKETNRDDTGTIQRRTVSVFLSCFLAVLFIRYLATPVEGYVAVGVRALTLWELFGVSLRELMPACLACLALTATLFLGPIVQHVVSVLEHESAFCRLRRQDYWISLRNWVLAPIAEEFLFRACLIRLWVGAGFPPANIVLYSPICFALAHVHHFVEHVRRTRSKKEALLQVAFQVFYTSLFGMYSSFLLVRTGSIVAVILTHTFCNHQGFPDLGFLVMEVEPLYRHRVWLGAVYLVGVALFCWLLAPLTAGFASSFCC